MALSLSIAGDSEANRWVDNVFLPDCATYRMGEKQRSVVSAAVQMKATQSPASQAECTGHVSAPVPTMLEMPSCGKKLMDAERAVSFTLSTTQDVC